LPRVGYVPGMRTRGPFALVAVAVVLSIAPGARAAAARDDTAWLQSRLDLGGALFLPKLANGECYATRGLWVPGDGTTITSDGACLVALGWGTRPGPTRPLRAKAVFLLDHVDLRQPQPVRISISGLDIRVPAKTRMAGIQVYGAEATLTDLTVRGAPTKDVAIGSGKLGDGGPTPRITVRNCRLSGASGDVLTASGAVGLHLEGNTLSGGRGVGIDLRAGDRGQPTLDVHVTGNRVIGNGGPGILVDLAPKNGLPLLASGIELARNEVLRNAARAPVPRRAGIVLAGGQSDRQGTLALTGNVVRENHGPGILGRKLALVVTRDDNDLRGNRGGAMKGLRTVVAARPPAADRAFTRIDAPATGAARDDTEQLQARLDAGGGTIFLPKLPNGECYATRGLWVSHDDTTITSDGACVVSLGPGEVRLRSTDGDPIPSAAVFYVNRSRKRDPAPMGVTISNLRIVVPAGEPMYGVAVYGHAVTLRSLDIGGSPKDDVIVGARANGNGYAGRVAILDSTLGGAARNAISATGVIGLTIEGNTIQGVRDSPPGQPAAGIDLEPDDRGQPALGVRIARNTIRDNAGPGILLELETNDGNSVLATDLEISGNTIVRNAAARTPPKRAGIVLSGGQDGVDGTLLLRENVVRDNGGPGILMRRLRLAVTASGNDVGGNED
jgi:Right handed beta helix region